MIDYKKLQNGSDIRGVAIAVEGGKPVDLNEQSASAIGSAFARWLVERTGKRKARVAIGRDSRLSGEALSQWLASGLTRMGADAVDLGMATTPAMFLSTITDGFLFDGAIMVTASHLPYERNGFKLFTRDGCLEADEIAAILALAAEGRFEPSADRGTLARGEFMQTYAKLLVEKIRSGAGMGEKPLSGLRILVDAGNGAGGFFASKVLVPLGADPEGSLFLEPDGRFPNHAPNPEDQAAMGAIREAVLRQGADLGIIFDTDVDRAGAVLPDGSELNRNRLIAAISAIVLRDHPGTTIVTDSITSTGLAAFIAARGGKHHRFKRGYKNVINESIRLNESGVDSELAMETSGHGALRENHFLDDGAYLMVKLLIELAVAKRRGLGLESLIAGLEEPKESAEYRLPLLSEDFISDGRLIMDALYEHAKTAPDMALAPNNYEGVRVDTRDGWFLLRLSLHEPLLSLSVESDVEGGVERMRDELYAFLSGFPALDASKLR